jgi:hypothetical protein
MSSFAPTLLDRLALALNDVFNQRVQPPRLAAPAAYGVIATATQGRRGPTSGRPPKAAPKTKAPSNRPKPSTKTHHGGKQPGALPPGSWRF